jgi:hypothetical protein
MDVRRRGRFGMTKAPAIAIAAAAVALAAGCGNSSSSSSSAGSQSPAAVLSQASAAAAKQSSVGFNIKLRLQLHGALKNAGSAAMFLQGPLGLALQGHTTNGTNGGQTKADIHFVVNFRGGSVSGELLAPGGRTAYVSAPTLLGPGWHSFPISSTSKLGSGATGGSSMLKMVNPAHLLGNLKVTSNGDTDTVSGQVEVRRLLTAALPLAGASVTGAERAQLTAVAASFKTAQGSLSVDSSTHLPIGFNAELKLVFAHALSASVDGLQGFDLNVTSTFSDWGKSFTVTKPAGATPLQLNGLGSSFSSGAGSA